jgi:hypothetical protein
MALSVPPSDDVALSVPHGVAIDAASLQKWLGITTNDAVFSAAWLSRDELGMAFLHHFGLLDSTDLIELSKGLSKNGARIFKFCGQTSGHNDFSRSPDQYIYLIIYRNKPATTHQLPFNFFFFSFFSRRGEPLSWFPFVLELRFRSGWQKLRLRRPRELGDRAFRTAA